MGSHVVGNRITDVNKPRFAVIGTGSMAQAMMSTFALAGVPVIAVASRDPQRSRRFASVFAVPTASDSLASVLRSTDINAVYIANSTAEHASTAVAALEAGKAVLCEKPLALSAAEAERVAKIARQTGTLCMEGLWTFFLPAYRRFLELAHRKACGEPAHLFADFGYPVSDEAMPRLLSPAGGGVLLDRGVYLIALALKVFGAVERVDARLDLTAQGVDQHASLQLTHRGSGHSQLSASFTALMSNTAGLACCKGIVALERPLIGTEMVSIRLEAAQHQSADPALHLGRTQILARSLRQSPLLRRLKRALPNTRKEHLSYGSNRYLPQLAHFLALLKAGERESDVIPLDLSLDILRVIDRARMDHRR
jgi:predicted dehydrogenase